MGKFRWGIVGTGTVARKFALGLRASAEAEAGIVVSRYAAKGRQFAEDLGIPRASASLAEAAADASIDAFYIATPASVHRDEAILCINAGRPVLVEKPFALDGGQARDIVEAARARSVFCMEAMWTRFLPLTGRLRHIVDSGALGDIRVVAGTFGIAEARSPGTAAYDRALGGGALLQRAVYPISLAYYLLGAPSRILAHASLGESGVDEDVSILFGYDGGAQALIHASLRTQSANDLVVEGTKGRIHVHPPIYCPFRMTVTPVRERAMPPAAPSRLGALKEHRLIRALYQRLSPLAPALIGPRSTGVTAPYAGNGYHYEAEEVMRCIRSGQRESKVMPLSESLDIMQALDRIRSNWEERSTTAPQFAVTRQQ